MRKLAAILLVLLSFAPRAAAEDTRGVHWRDLSLEQSLKQAGKDGKLVLLDCWATWCVYCIVMDREIWSQEALARVVEEETIPVRAEVDPHKGLGLDLRLRYQVQGMPLVLLLHPEDGRVLGRLEGIQTPESIIHAIDEARTLAWPERQAEADSDNPAALLRLAGQLLRGGDGEKALGYARRVRELDPTCSQDAADDAALLMADLFTKTQEPDKAREALFLASTKCQGASGILEIWERLVARDREAGDAARLGETLARRVDLFPRQVGPRLDLATWLTENGSEPGKVLAILDDALALDAEDTRVLEALARHYNAQDDPERALDLLEEAIRIDPHDPELRELRLRIVLANR